MGADNGDIVGLLLREGAALTSIGLVLGVGTSLGLTRTLRGMLFEIEPTDAVTFVAVAALLGIAATIANYVPARRAAKVDPVIAIRAE